MRKIKKQLKNLRVIKLDKAASEEMRDILLSKIKNDITVGDRSPRSPISLISIFTPSVRAIIVSLIVVLIPGGGFTTVKAALSSLPGDFLYPVKITTEKIQVALVSDEDEKTQLRVGFAERRLQEAEEIINKEENGERGLKITLAVKKFKEEIESITDGLENLEDESQKVIEDKIALLNNKAEEIAQVIDANDTSATSTEVVVDVDDVSDIIVSAPTKNPASTTIMMINTPQTVEPAEPEDPPESFKIQLQIIKE